jgi:hypothetical protein
MKNKYYLSLLVVFLILAFVRSQYSCFELEEC